MAKPDKWRFAIGTTSRVPHSDGCGKLYPGCHYLILDYDNVPFQYVFEQLQWSRWITGPWDVHIQPTKNGWHVYTHAVATFGVTLNRARKMGADPAWLRIGEKRGYLFLADKAPVPLPWPVERMVIARDIATPNHRSPL